MACNRPGSSPPNLNNLPQGNRIDNVARWLGDPQGQFGDNLILNASIGSDGIANQRPPSLNSSCSSGKESTGPDPYGANQPSMEIDLLNQAAGLSAEGRPTFYSSGSSGSARSRPPSAAGRSSGSRESSRSRPQSANACGNQPGACNLNISGGSGLSGVNAPSFASSSSGGYSAAPAPCTPPGGGAAACPRNVSGGQPNACTPPRSPGLGQQFNMNISGGSGLGGVNAPSFASSASGGYPVAPPPCTPPGAAACPRNVSGGQPNACTPPRSPFNQLTYNISGGSGISRMNAPSFPSSSSGGGTSGSSPYYSAVSHISSPGAVAPCPRNVSGGQPNSFSPPRSPFNQLTYNISGGSGIAGVNAPSFESTCSSINPPPLNISGGSGLGGIYAPSFASSSSGSGANGPCPLTSTQIQGPSNIVRNSPPQACARPPTPCSPQDNFAAALNQSGAGLDGVSPQSMNSSPCSPPGNSPQACPRNRGIQSVSPPNLTNSSGGSAPGYFLPQLNPSPRQGGACARTPPCAPPSPNLPEASGGGLDDIDQPDFNSTVSSIQAPSLDDTSGSGIDGVFAPNFNSTFSSEEGEVPAPACARAPYTSTPCQGAGGNQTGSPNLMQFSPPPSPPDLMQFSPIRSPPNMIQFSPNPSPPNMMQFSPGTPPGGARPGELTRLAQMAFGDGSYVSPDNSFGVRPLNPAAQCTRRSEGSILQGMVNDAQNYLMNMTSSSEGSSVPDARPFTPSSSEGGPEGSYVVWSPYRNTIGQSTLDELRWGSFEEDIIRRQFEDSRMSGGDFAGAGPACARGYDMNLAATLPFANTTLNSTNVSTYSQEPVPPEPFSWNGSVCNKNNSFNSQGSDGFGGGGAAMMVVPQNLNTSGMSACSRSSGYSSMSSNRSALMQNSQLSGISNASSNRVFDITALKMWVMKVVSNACQGQCGKPAWECEEHTLKNLMSLVTSWRNLYSQGREEGRCNNSQLNQSHNSSLSSDSGMSSFGPGSPNSSCCSRR